MAQVEQGRSKFEIASQLFKDIDEMFKKYEEGLTTLNELKMQLINRVAHFADKEF